MEEALDVDASFSEEAVLSLLDSAFDSVFASLDEDVCEAELEADSALDSLAEVLWLSLVDALELPEWDVLAAPEVLDALELDDPEEALVLDELLEPELVLWDVLPEELPDWEPDSAVTPLPMETVSVLLLTVVPL